MDTQQFEQLIKQKAQELKKYAELEFPTEAGNTALRFIDGNFRAQGWQGETFQRWKSNKRNGRILVDKGHLRNASYYITAPAVATIRNTRPQAKIHNEGGKINIPITPKMRRYAWAMYAKTMGIKKENSKTNWRKASNIKSSKDGKSWALTEKNKKVGKEAGKWLGIALTKNTYLTINMEQRQFAPTPSSPSPVLNKAVERGIVRKFKQIFT